MALGGKTEATMKDGLYHGLERWWYRSGGQLFMERTWKDGQRDGVEQWWLKNGTNFEKNEWKAGKIVRRWPVLCK